MSTGAAADASERAAHLADGRAAADAAGGRRAGARRHRAGRRPRATFTPLAFVAALLGALFIQVGTNLSNDYSDARRGADTEDRLGPGAGDGRRPRAAAPGAGRDLRRVRRWRCSCGVYLIAIAGPGAAARSAPPRSSPACSTPAGRGPTATRASARCSSSSSSASSRSTGSYYVQTEELDVGGVRARRPVGLLAAAILVVNNVRDLETDRRAGKRTLAVRLGRERARAALRGDARGRVPDGAAAVAARGDADGLAAAAAAARSRSALPVARSCASTPTARRSTPRWRRPGCSQLVFCVLLSIGLLAS